MAKHADLSQSKPFERNFLPFQRDGHHIYKVFEEFLEMTTISLCNALTLKDERREEREAKYMSIVGKYKKEVVDLFPQMFADLVELIEKGMEDGDVDPLGEFFQEHITHGEHGQFFTPMHICRMMAQMTMGNIEPKATVLDPACGSGRTLISALEISREIEVHACDLDKRCFQMATINLFLRGATGYTYRMNSLSMEIYGGFKFGIWGGCVPYLIELKKEEITFTKPQKEQIQQAAAVKLDQGTGQQMTLF